MISKGALIAGVGAAILALLMIDQIKTSSIVVLGFPLEQAIIFLGGATILIGIIVIMIGLSKLVFNGLLWGTQQVVVLTDFMQFRAEPATEAELQKIHKMAFDFFEGDVSPLEKMIEWQRRNSDIFWVVFRDENSRSKISGYFCVIPILKSATKLIKNEHIKGSEFSVDHITSKISRNKPYALYIGAVAANGIFARAASLNHIDQFMHHMKRKNVNNVYTRPVTKDGLRLCKKRGFKPVDRKVKDQLNRVYHRNMDDF